MLTPLAHRLPALALGALLWALLPVAAAQSAEQRQAYSTGAPQWLQAVGKLQVPGSRWHKGRRQHHREDCSATLVAAQAGQRADTVVTAWHCLQYYDDLSRPLLFTLLPGSGQPLTREVYRVADGGGMGADWAILKMHRPVPADQVAAIAPNPGTADVARPVTMAGYSRDDGLGKRGEALTFDGNCQILLQGYGDSDTDCEAYKGASGGAVVQLSGTGEPLLSGVISRGDSDALSIFVPVARFRSALRLQLAR